jgi:hypothetical protein
LAMKFVHFYTVHHFHYTYVPAGVLTLNYFAIHVLVSTQHFLKSLQIFIRNVFKKHWLKHMAKIHNRRCQFSYMFWMSSIHYQGV